MTKKEFIELYAKKGNFDSKTDAERKVKAFLETLEEVFVNGEEITFVGWGKWEIVNRPERTGRNPQTGIDIIIPAKKVIKFKAGKTLEDKINGK